jgi:hypothetical protein
VQAGGLLSRDRVVDGAVLDGDKLARIERAPRDTDARLLNLSWP